MMLDIAMMWLVKIKQMLEEAVLVFLLAFFHSLIFQ